MKIKWHWLTWLHFDVIKMVQVYPEHKRILWIDLGVIGLDIEW